MAGGRRVRARVLRRRGVAAADVPALRAPPQVDPPAAGRVALDAAGAARRHRGSMPASRSSLSGSVTTAESASSRGGSSGSRTRKRVSPGADSTFRSPWCLLTTIRHEMSSPSPVPSPTGLVVKNGSKMRPRMSSGTPGPVSPNSTSSQSSSRAGAYRQRALARPWPHRVVDQVRPHLVELGGVRGIGGSERS